MQRFGAVIVFKEGVARETAELALDEIGGLLDPDKCTPRADASGFRVEEYDDTEGNPVWYIP